MVVVHMNWVGGSRIRMISRFVPLRASGIPVLMSLIMVRPLKYGLGIHCLHNLTNNTILLNLPSNWITSIKVCLNIYHPLIVGLDRIKEHWRIQMWNLLQLRRLDWSRSRGMLRSNIRNRIRNRKQSGLNYSLASMYIVVLIGRQEIPMSSTQMAVIYFEIQY